MMDCLRYYLSICLEYLRSFTAVACLHYCCPRSLINWGILREGILKETVMACLDDCVSEWKTLARKITKKAPGYWTESPHNYHHENMYLSVITLCGVLFVLPRLLGKLWRRLEDNIKMKFKEIGWGNGMVACGAGGIRGGLMLTR
jgi:hypothetical protein